MRTPSGHSWLALERSTRVVTARLQHERTRLAALRARPVLADAGGVLRAQRELVSTLRRQGRERTRTRLARARDHTSHLTAQLRTLSPQSTLDRGYAIVQDRDGHVVLDPTALRGEDLIRVTVARGDFGARVVGPEH